jgi:UDP:flavonoid glycosyltransferase YjiC (YdhE family)
MAHVLFVTWDGGGNLPPALGIAAELQRRGDSVRFIGHAQQGMTIEAAGFGFEPYMSAGPWSCTEPIVGPSGSAYGAVFSDRGIGDDLLTSVRRDPVDLVVIDGLLVGALDSAHRAGLRRAILVHSFYSVMHDALNSGPLGNALRLQGYEPARLYSAADRVLAATLEAIDPAVERKLSGGISYTGPILPSVSPPPLKSGSAEPTILVSLSTTYIDGQAAALQSILDAVAGLPLHAVVTTGPSVNPADLRAPGNAELHRHLPHAAVMRNATLVVGHGGHATTMLALAHGLPLVIMPMSPAFDQPTIGRVVQEQGAGRMLEKSATASEIEHAIADLLRPGSHRDAAGRLGVMIRERNGAAAAADHLEFAAAKHHN